MRCLQTVLSASVVLAALSGIAHAEGVEPPGTLGGVLVKPIVVDLGADYVTKTAPAKQAELLKLITATKYAEGQLPNYPEKHTIAKKAMLANRMATKPDYLNYLMAADTDVMSSTREKGTHRRGVAGTIRFVPSASNGMTGIFSQPAEGLVRLSLTVAFSEGRDFKPALNPSMGLKFFVDGKPSVNLVALHALDGAVNVDDKKSDTHAFFAPDLKTTFAVTPVTAGGKFLKWAIDKHFTPPDDWNRLSLASLMGTKSDGTSEAQPTKEPHHLVFRAPTTTHNLIAADDDRDFRVSLASKVKSGFTIYDVYVADEKKVEKLIGHILMTSDLYASEVGDRLHFKHEFTKLKLKNPK